MKPSPPASGSPDASSLRAPSAPFPSPFDAGEPHPRARAAAEGLQAELRAGRVDAALLSGAQGGKMFGVLVARDADGAEVILHAFSGMLGGLWSAPGFAPPLFDAALRERVEVPGERAVKRLWEQHLALLASPELAFARARHAALAAQHAAALGTFKAAQAARRLDRARRREGASGPALDALAQESRRDKAALRWLREEQARELAAALAPLQRLERRLRASDRLRAHVSRRLMTALFDTYRVPNFEGGEQPLRSLFEGEPPSGAGDCAAPRLLAWAARRGLSPVALAEFWWGGPGPSGGRVQGEYAPACRHKCGPLLPFMLRGLEVAAPRGLGAEAQQLAPLRVLYRDDHLVAVEKPPGLLSVPGKGESLSDSAQTRLQAQWPGARLVHRLDLDTSGVLLAALDAPSHRALQRQFAARQVEKRYVAWVDGPVAAASGTIDLALRVDLEDRPRQLHDPLHGRKALTAYRVLGTAGARTCLELRPLTGRTHQLRVHAAHPLGLGAPIQGDRLYGRRGPRLMLHAQSLTFTHPFTGARVEVLSPPDFPGPWATAR